MPTLRVLPLIVSVKSPDAPGELREAFSTAEPAENAKIADWAWRFGFEIAEAFVIDLAGRYDQAALMGEILDRVKKAKARGVVVAGLDYLRRAHLLDALYERLAERQLELWSANLGGDPVTRPLEV